MLPHQLLIGIQGLVGRVGVVGGKAAAQLLVHQTVLHAPLRRLGGVRVCNVLEGRGFGRLRTARGVPQQQGSLGTVLRHGHALRQQSFQLLLAPLPHAAGTTTPLMPQAGVGLCAFKTTDQKAEAAAVFLRWFTEQQRNLEFAADTGYMPVSSAAFDAIADYPFEQQSYQRLYDVYNEMRLQNTPLSEPGIVGYHAKAKALYDSLRQRQKDYPQRLANGETLEALTEETWQLLCDNA